MKRSMGKSNALLLDSRRILKNNTMTAADQHPIKGRYRLYDKLGLSLKAIDLIVCCCMLVIVIALILGLSIG